MTNCLRIWVRVCRYVCLNQHNDKFESERRIKSLNWSELLLEEDTLCIYIPIITLVARAKDGFNCGQEETVIHSGHKDVYIMPMTSGPTHSPKTSHAVCKCKRICIHFHYCSISWTHFKLETRITFHPQCEQNVHPEPTTQLTEQNLISKFVVWIWHSISLYSDDHACCKTWRCLQRLPQTTSFPRC